MRCGGYHSVVKKAEGVLWLQSTHYTYEICQTVEEKPSPTLREPEITLLKRWNGAWTGLPLQASHCQDTVSA